MIGGIIILDKSSNTIQIGDIVRIENSPIKSDNGLYVVVQDGTSELYNDTKSLTMYKAVRAKNGGFTLSTAKSNICFFPLVNFSSRYKYTREEMNAATIEIIEEAKPEAFIIAKADDNAAEYEPNEKDMFYAEVTQNDKKIEDVSYLVSQADKLTAFFSNLSLREGQILTIVKQRYNDDTNYYERRGLFYELRKTT